MKKIMKKIMLMRLKMPPAINQFNMIIDKNQAATLLKLHKKYTPETREAKKARLMEMAQQKKKDGQEVKTKKPQVIKYGLSHVTTLCENKEAKLVVMAHDGDPTEMVCWLPALSRKKDVPYCIIKGPACSCKISGFFTWRSRASRIVRKLECESPRQGQGSSRHLA
jgi:large subunit ribosomal protein L7Ae